MRHRCSQYLTDLAVLASLPLDGTTMPQAAMEATALRRADSSGHEEVTPAEVTESIKRLIGDGFVRPVQPPGMLPRVGLTDEGAGFAARHRTPGLTE